MSVPDTVRHGSRDGDLRELPGLGLQLPHDRHPGRRRPRAAEAPARHRRAPPRARRALSPSCSPASTASRPPIEPELGALQLAELLRAPRPGHRPARRHAAHARPRASPRAAASCASTSRPAYGDLPRRIPCRAPRPRATTASCCRSMRQMTDEEQAQVVEGLAEAVERLRRAPPLHAARAVERPRAAAEA